MPTIASRLERRAERGEDLAFDLFFLGGRLDHEIAIAEIVERLRRADALERGLALLVGDALAGDLAGKIAADGGEPSEMRSASMIVERHVEAGRARRHGRCRCPSDPRRSRQPCGWYGRRRHDRRASSAAPSLRPSSLTCSRLVPCRFRSTTAAFSNFSSSCGQFRQRLIKIGHQPIVGDLEDRRFLVLVDRHDHLRSPSCRPDAESRLKCRRRYRGRAPRPCRFGRPASRSAHSRHRPPRAKRRRRRRACRLPALYIW